ncbi:MAG: 16S rRNA (cytosine(967)-C(5))-methyltransferase RsmB [Bacillota bacterium]|nr:16S rRNA (cytosine(967)-C(5))-methyltransferase RsmB [Bacillota bacterium]
MKNKGVSGRKAREAALKALVRLEQDQAYLNLALPALLTELEQEDRALAARLATGTVRMLNSLDWMLGLFLKHPLESLTPWIRNLLRLSAYQIIYLERIPDYAAVDEAVALSRRYGHRGVAGLVNAVLRKLVAESKSLPWPEREQQPVEYLSLKYGLPVWLAKRALDVFSLTEAEDWADASNTPARISLRPNILRVSSGKLAENLLAEGLETEKSTVSPVMLRVVKGITPSKTDAFSKGLFTIQGESSSLVSLILNPKPGEIILDLCSAPGGKTTHLAELSNDRGIIYAVELHPKRLKLVVKAAARLGLKSIQPIQADGRKLDAGRIKPPDSILVDAPCSGLGVIRRLPEIKWRRNEDTLMQFQKLQLELLASAAAFLKPGGKLLYSVCTTEPEETREVVSIFNRLHRDFSQIAAPALLPDTIVKDQEDPVTITFRPHRHDLDGFFIAMWRKKG